MFQCLLLQCVEDTTMQLLIGMLVLAVYSAEANFAEETEFLNDTIQFFVQCNHESLSICFKVSEFHLGSKFTCVTLCVHIFKIEYYIKCLFDPMSKL